MTRNNTGTSAQKGKLKFYCDICDLKLIGKNKFAWHLEKTHFPQNLECSLCTSAFSFENDRARHLAESHQQPFCCWCEKAFNSKELAESHKCKRYDFYF